MTYEVKSKIKIVCIILMCLMLFLFVVWFLGSFNPETPAGYVGYLTKGAIFGKTQFYGLQIGPTSPGRTWLLNVTNVSITPFTYTEDFVEKDSVLSKDNLKIEFRVHITWKVKSDDIKIFMEKYSTLTSNNDNPNRVVEVAYGNFLKEPLRMFSRDEIQRLKGLEIKDQIVPIGKSIFDKLSVLTKETPFEVMGVVVGNIQYPKEVADAVSTKMAATQVLERKETEVAIKRKEKEIRIVEAEGIARAMEIIQSKLTPLYLQHEAIEAQKLMVNSPNHTTVYIPTGNMGVPLVGTFQVSKEKK